MEQNAFRCNGCKHFLDQFFHGRQVLTVSFLIVRNFLTYNSSPICVGTPAMKPHHTMSHVQRAMHQQLSRLWCHFARKRRSWRPTTTSRRRTTLRRMLDWHCALIAAGVMSSIRYCVAGIAWSPVGTCRSISA